MLCEILMYYFGIFPHVLFIEIGSPSVPVSQASLEPMILQLQPWDAEITGTDHHTQHTLCLNFPYPLA